MQSNATSSSSSSSFAASPAALQAAFPGLEVEGQPWSRATLNQELWDTIEYNSVQFNIHKMPKILVSVLQEPRQEALTDPRLDAYLLHAQHSAKIWEELKTVPAKDIAASIKALRQLGLPAAEDLSDVLRDTVSEKLGTLSLARVSFYVTTFSLHGLYDAVFWRSAAAAVTQSREEVTPRVLTSLFDSFRKSGLKSERLFQALTHRVYDCLDRLDANQIAPIVATLCRVSLKTDKYQALQPLISRFQNFVREDNSRPVSQGNVRPAHICSMTISLSLIPEGEINTAPFAIETSKHVERNLNNMNAEDIIVFLWGVQQLAAPAVLKPTFLAGITRILQQWPQLDGSLSMQRLTQLADVLVLTGSECGWPKECVKLQDCVIDSITDLLHYCGPNTFADQLEIWGGGTKFWRRYPDFARALASTLHNYLTDPRKLKEIWPALQAVQGYPELFDSLPEGSEAHFARAVQMRPRSDQERIRALFAGTSWERICGEAPPATIEEDEEEEEEAEAEAEELMDEVDGTRRSNATNKLQGGFEGRLSEALETAAAAAAPAPAATAPTTATTAAAAKPAHRKLFEAFTTSAPLAQRRGRPEGSEEAYKKLVEVADLLEIAASEGDLTKKEVFSLLRSCAAGGVPHVGLFKLAAEGSGAIGSTLKSLEPLDFVEALECAAKVRLRLPEFEEVLRGFLREGKFEWLHGPGLARLTLAAAEIRACEEAEILALLQRCLEISSRSRVPTSLCYALHLAKATPSKVQLDRICQSFEEPRTPVQKMVMRDFALGLLGDSAGFSTVQALPLSARAVLAEVALGEGITDQLLAGSTAPPSDSTLLLRDEVTKTLERTGKAYDLEVPVAPGLSADLALPGPAGILWLLDGPEAFHYPQNHEPELLPSEERRGELLRLALDDEAVEDLEKHLQSWLPAGRSAKLNLLGSAKVDRANFPKRVARMDFKSWPRLSPSKQELVLLDPRSFLLRRR